MILNYYVMQVNMPKKGPNLWSQPDRVQQVAEEVRAGRQFTLESFRQIPSLVPISEK
jgi:hypothetical protein